MLIDTFIVIIASACMIMLFSPHLLGCTLWRATVTPLASIIGSGFLVLGPILVFHYGGLAPLVMAALCLCAYLFGGTIRYNIAAISIAETKGTPRPALVRRMEDASSWALTLAYIISVTYYLNLFGAFAVNLTPFASDTSARLVTTTTFLGILAIGWLRGFAALERLEYAVVALKLAIIAGVLAGLSLYFSEHVLLSDAIQTAPQISGWAALTLAFGLIITVQGFETSRYLGDTYAPQIRIRSMRIAQWLSTVIYLGYTALLTFSFSAEKLALSETAIIDMMRIVSPILPFILVTAALAAQLSAAIADTSGSGGLLEELTRGKLSTRQAYVILTLAGLLLTWSANVFEIIAYASRAFAIYYALQAGIAAWTSFDRKDGFKRSAFFALLAIFASLIALFGQAVEV